MKALPAALVVAVLAALVVVGCRSPGEPVTLAMRTDPYTPWCHTFGINGRLVPDASAGTAIVEDAEVGGRTVPVFWPDGFTGWRIGDVVEVRDDHGNVIAQTGRHYYFLGGYGEGGWRGCKDVIPD